MSKESEQLERIANTLDEVLKWVKSANKSKIMAIMDEELKDPENRIVYQNSDGKTSSRDIAKLVSMGKNAVTTRWTKWIATGIAESISVRGGGTRAKRLFSLDEFGIELDSQEKSEETESPEQKEDATGGLRDE